MERGSLAAWFAKKKERDRETTPTNCNRKPDNRRTDVVWKRDAGADDNRWRSNWRWHRSNTFSAEPARYSAAEFSIVRPTTKLHNTESATQLGNAQSAAEFDDAQCELSIAASSRGAGPVYSSRANAAD
jgi:hypothetical protein